MFAFCYLPLPVQTGLPVHINAHFALDHEARRNIWWPDEPRMDLKKEWNKTVVQEVIVPAYAKAISHFRDELFPTEVVLNAVGKLDLFYSIFPDIKLQTDGIWLTLTKMVYEYIRDNNICVLPVVNAPYDEVQLTSGPKNLCTRKTEEEKGRKIEEETCFVHWVSLAGTETSPAYYNDLWIQIQRKFAEDPNIEVRRTRRQIYMDSPKEADMISKILKNLGMNVTDVPSWIYQSMADSNVKFAKVTQEAVLRFLTIQTKASNLQVDRDVQMTQYSSGKNVEYLLWYCAMDTQAMENHLEGCPLMLTADGNIRIFSSTNVVYVTSFPDILPHSGRKIAHETMLTYLRDEKRKPTFSDLCKNVGNGGPLCASAFEP